MRTTFLSLTFAAFILCSTLTGCESLTPKSDTLVRNGTMATITGQVVYRDRDGGFYGILTDNGAQLEPINLDARFRTDGAHVMIQGKLDSSRLGEHEWGNPVEVVSVRGM